MTYRSLKSAVSDIATILGGSPDWLYERQRELVRKGLLPAPAKPKRGPGSGAPFTPDCFYMLLAGVLFTDNLSDLRDADPQAVKSLAKRIGRAIVNGEDVLVAGSRNGVVITRSFTSKQMFRFLALLDANERAEAA